MRNEPSDLIRISGTHAACRMRWTIARGALLPLAALALVGCTGGAPDAGATAQPTAPSSVSASAGAADPGATDPAPAPAAAASASAAPSGSVPALPGERPDGYSVAISGGGRAPVYLAVDALAAMPAVTIDTPTAGMPQQTGVAVRTVLEAAGFASWSSITVTGPGGATTLAAADLTDTVILGASKRQTIRFSGQELDREAWVQDVTAIEVAP